MYTALSGGFWLLTGIFIFWGLWQGKTWAWFSALGGIAGCISWYWVDRLIFQKPHSNWPFAVVITGIILFTSLIILFSPSARHFFHRDTHEQKNEIITSA